jgi:hypothetical protein
VAPGNAVDLSLSSVPVLVFCEFGLVDLAAERLFSERPPASSGTPPPLDETDAAPEARSDRPT